MTTRDRSRYAGLSALSIRGAPIIGTDVRKGDCLLTLSLSSSLSTRDNKTVQLYQIAISEKSISYCVRALARLLIPTAPLVIINLLRLKKAFYCFEFYYFDSLAFFFPLRLKPVEKLCLLRILRFFYGLFILSPLPPRAPKAR